MRGAGKGRAEMAEAGFRAWEESGEPRAASCHTRFPFDRRYEPLDPRITPFASIRCFGRAGDGTLVGLNAWCLKRMCVLRLGRSYNELCTGMSVGLRFLAETRVRIPRFGNSANLKIRHYRG